MEPGVGFGVSGGHDIGQGRVSSRVTQHLRKVGNPQEPQGEVFQADMECSWALNDTWQEHQRLELENDLIAAYSLSMGAFPLAQLAAGSARA